jgi:predicted transposase/invertase (TIGR01784 family)
MPVRNIEMSGIIKFDAAYKKLFSHKQMVEELIRSFVHEEFVREIDFSTLKRLSEVYITKHFRRRELDRIWEVKFKDRKIYFYILIEFQSTVEKYMALRILNYMTLFYLDLLKVETLEKLPVVFPIVLYNGGRDWTAPLDFRELVDSPFTSDKPYIPHFRYYKIAEKDFPEEDLIALDNPVAAAFLVDTSDASQLKDDPDKRKKLVKVLLRILVGIPDNELKREFTVWIHRMFRRKKITVDLSIANEEEVTHMLMESIEKLKIEGKMEGKMEGRMEVARELKKMGQDIEFIMKATGLPREEIENL